MFISYLVYNEALHSMPNSLYPHKLKWKKKKKKKKNPNYSYED